MTSNCEFCWCVCEVVVFVLFLNFVLFLFFIFYFLFLLITLCVCVCVCVCVRVCVCVCACVCVCCAEDQKIYIYTKTGHTAKGDKQPWIWSVCVTNCVNQPRNIVCVGRKIKIQMVLNSHESTSENEKWMNIVTMTGW